MYQWLAEEIAKINTEKFHVVDGPIVNEQQLLVAHSPLAVPSSYKQFVIEFGNANLYRKRTNYLVKIFAVPVDAVSDKGEQLLHFGRTDHSLAYFKESLLRADGEAPVFEWRNRRGITRTADGFYSWLTSTCQRMRKQFTRREWLAIEKGPPPFTRQEQCIVDARRKYDWRVLGIATNGDLRFEVFNGSILTLPYLSVGIRYKNGDAFGRSWLPVSHIEPGEKRIVPKDCYKKLHDPESIEAFELADPEPSTRDLYWEFRGID